jgi:hypothetical protein
LRVTGSGSMSYGGWTLTQLKDECARRALQTSGAKDCLVEQLQVYDKGFQAARAGSNSDDEGESHKARHGGSAKLGGGERGLAPQATKKRPKDAESGPGQRAEEKEDGTTLTPQTHKRPKGGDVRDGSETNLPASLSPHKDGEDGMAPMAQPPPDVLLARAPRPIFALGCEVVLPLGDNEVRWTVLAQQPIDGVWHYDLESKGTRNVPLEKLHQPQTGGGFTQFKFESDVSQGNVVFYRVGASEEIFARARVVAVHPPRGEQHYDIVLLKPSVEEHRLAIALQPE